MTAVGDARKRAAEGCVPCDLCGGSQTRGWHKHDAEGTWGDLFGAAPDFSMPDVPRAVLDEARRAAQAEMRAEDAEAQCVLEVAARAQAVSWMEQADEQWRLWQSRAQKAEAENADLREQQANEAFATIARVTDIRDNLAGASGLMWSGTVARMLDEALGGGS